jgi:nucleotide-binding universal stress UspA family protein
LEAFAPFRLSASGEFAVHKLLIPIDGSDNAMRALDYALRLAKEGGPIAIRLLTVHPEPVIYGEIQIYVSTQKVEELQEQHSRDILRPAEAAAKAAGVPFESEVIVGDTASTIVRRAEELGCDGIVMGTRGMTAIGNLVMGSTATKVIHLARLPVTLIK